MKKNTNTAASYSSEVFQPGRDQHSYPSTAVKLSNMEGTHYHELLKITTKWPPGQIGHQKCIFEWSRAIEIDQKNFEIERPVATTE